MKLRRLLSWARRLRRESRTIGYEDGFEAGYHAQLDHRGLYRGIANAIAAAPYNRLYGLSGLSYFDKWDVVLGIGEALCVFDKRFDIEQFLDACESRGD